MLVAVQFADRSHPGEYRGRTYAYQTDLPLSVGAEVVVPARQGEAKAVVRAVDVPVESLAGYNGPVRSVIREHDPDSENRPEGAREDVSTDGLNGTGDYDRFVERSSAED